MVDYYKNYAEKDNLNPGLGWKNTFEDLFGMTWLAIMWKAKFDWIHF